MCSQSHIFVSHSHLEKDLCSLKEWYVMSVIRDVCPALSTGSTDQAAGQCKLSVKCMLGFWPCWCKIKERSETPSKISHLININRTASKPFFSSLPAIQKLCSLVHFVMTLSSNQHGKIVEGMWCARVCNYRRPACGIIMTIMTTWASCSHLFLNLLCTKCSSCSINNGTPGVCMCVGFSPH